MSLPEVNYYNYPRELLDPSYECPICRQNTTEDEGELWVGHPHKDSSSPDFTELRHFIHKNCSDEVLKDRTQCIFNDAIIKSQKQKLIHEKRMNWCEEMGSSGAGNLAFFSTMILPSITMNLVGARRHELGDHAHLGMFVSLTITTGIVTYYASKVLITNLMKKQFKD